MKFKTLKKSNKTTRNEPKASRKGGNAKHKEVYQTNPYRLVINLDDVEFKDRESLIDEWEASMKIATEVLDLDKQTLIRSIENSFVGIVKLIWDGTKSEERN